MWWEDVRGAGNPDLENGVGFPEAAIEIPGGDTDLPNAELPENRSFDQRDKATQDG